MDIPSNFKSLADKFDCTGVQSIVLMGSFSRNEATEYSDIDIVRFAFNNECKNLPGNGSHIIDNRLVVVSDVNPSQVEEWFFEPNKASNCLQGVKNAKILIDRNQYFTEIQNRAFNFKWDDIMQQKANQYARKEMVGNIEEVHKGLAGLKRGEIGRILNARHGLSWGLCNIVQVQKGILRIGDNSFFDQIITVMGADSDWSKLCHISFGIDGKTSPTLKEQIIAGLKLYILTADLLKDIFNIEDVALIDHTIVLINDLFGELKIN